MPPPLDLLPSLLTGLLVTLQITAGAAVVALVSSFLAGLGRLSGRRTVRGIWRLYVDVFRGTSALVQLFWAYFALPLLGLRLEAVTVGILVLGLNLGSYGSEIVRSAIRSVSQSQYDAAAALNLSRRQTLWRIILPQAALRMIPPFGNLFIELLKGTALVSLISLADLTFQGQTLRTSTLRSGEIFALILVLYFLLAQVIARGMRFLESKLAAGRDSGGAA
jgi:polar amino acid transport system permease protein